MRRESEERGERGEATHAALDGRPGAVVGPGMVSSSHSQDRELQVKELTKKALATRSLVRLGRSIGH